MLKGVGREDVIENAGRVPPPTESGEGVVSGSLLLPKDGRPNRLSRDEPLALGGGGNDWVPAGSGEGRCGVGRGARVRDMLAAGAPSRYMLVGLWLRGGEYGGGGRGEPAFSH